jgi:hypothetical protein
VATVLVQSWPTIVDSLAPQTCLLLQIVMSRTFGNASPEGGVGVRMCVPLIDMLNHAGDEAVDGLLLTGEVVSRDNVRWDVVAPDNTPSGSWEMVLTSTKPISNGEPLLLSYREGLNEEFMLCYGFVPPSNPHDTVQLFSGLNEALEHLWQQDLAQVGSRHSKLHLQGVRNLCNPVYVTWHTGSGLPVTRPKTPLSYTASCMGPSQALSLRRPQLQNASTQHATEASHA